MCPYGVIVDDQKYVMFLSKSAEAPGLWTAVEDGCGVKTLSVQNKMVLVGEVKMSLDDLRQKYKF